MAGLYIAFEGIVGSGKSTQSKKLFNHLKEKFSQREIILTREPGSSQIADEIRKIVQGTKFHENMEATCEAYLYASSRAQTLRKIVKPALEKGGIVISDRSYLSSAAYQGEARNLGISKVLEINKIAVEDIVPDIIIYIDIDAKTGLGRSFDSHGDKFENESIDFFKRIQLGYYKLSNMPELKKKWINVPGNKDIDSVHKDIIEKLSGFLQ